MYSLEERKEKTRQDGRIKVHGNWKNSTRRKKKIGTGPRDEDWPEKIEWRVRSTNQEAKKEFGGKCKIERKLFLSIDWLLPFKKRWISVMAVPFEGVEYLEWHLSSGWLGLGRLLAYFFVCRNQNRYLDLATELISVITLKMGHQYMLIWCLISAFVFEIQRQRVCVTSCWEFSHYGRCVWILLKRVKFGYFLTVWITD